MNRILKLDLVLFTFSFRWKIYFKEWFIVVVTSSKSVHRKRIHTNSSRTELVFNNPYFILLINTVNNSSKLSLIK